MKICSPRMSDTLAPGERARVLVPTKNDVLNFNRNSQRSHTNLDRARASLGMTGALSTGLPVSLVPRGLGTRLLPGMTPPSYHPVRVRKG